MCAVFCRFLREQPKGLVPEEALIVNQLGSTEQEISFDWGRLLEDLNRLNFHEPPPTAYQKGADFQHGRAPMNSSQSLKSLFEIVTTLSFRCQYVEKLGKDPRYAKTIPTAAYSDRAVLMKPKFKKGSSGKWLLRLELFPMEDMESSFDLTC